jgi:16S rRNA processing protein RimM
MNRVFIEIGKLGRPHGVSGEIKYIPIEKNSNLLSNIKSLYIGKAKKLLFIEFYKKGLKPRIKVEGLDSPELVKGLINSQVYIKREHFPALTKDEFYLSDFIGANVVDSRRCLLGTIDSYYHNGAQDIVKLSTGIEFPLIRGAFIEKLCEKTKTLSLSISKEDILV